MAHYIVGASRKIKESDLVGKVDMFVLIQDLISGLKLLQVSRVCKEDKPGEKLYMCNVFVIRNRLHDIVHTSDHLSIAIQEYNHLIQMYNEYK